MPIPSTMKAVVLCTAPTTCASSSARSPRPPPVSKRERTQIAVASTVHIGTARLRWCEARGRATMRRAASQARGPVLSSSPPARRPPSASKSRRTVHRRGQDLGGCGRPSLHATDVTRVLIEGLKVGSGPEGDRRRLPRRPHKPRTPSHATPDGERWPMV
jgi:hypothetical protein